jgi:hypothetical protein
VSNADGRTTAEAPIVAFWTSTFFVGDDKQTARTRSNEDEGLRIAGGGLALRAFFAAL